MPPQCARLRIRGKAPTRRVPRRDRRPVVRPVIRRHCPTPPTGYWRDVATMPRRMKFTAGVAGVC